MFQIYSIQTTAELARYKIQDTATICNENNTYIIDCSNYIKVSYKTNQQNLKGSIFKFYI